MDQETSYLIAVQSLHDHCQTVIDAHQLTQSEDDLSTLRGVAQILFSKLQELQEREEEQ